MTWQQGLEGTALNIAATADSPLRVMAGLGTGKTFAMKRRVMRLLHDDAVPKRILVVTFTRTAAADLVRELKALGVAGCEDIRAGTLHAFCFSLLSRADVFDYLGRVPRPIIMINKSGTLHFEGGPLLEDLNNPPLFGNLRERTKRVRAFEAAWARLQSDEPGWPEGHADHAFNAALTSWLRFHNAILIGELVPLALRFLRDNPASPYRTAFDHVIVDEYQDLNKAEQVVIELLSKQASNVVVGDEDQSIYGFRHANPDGFRDFALTHDHTHDETLHDCHRCPKIVVRMADSLIRHNHVGSQPGDRLRPRTANPDGIVRIVQWSGLEAEIEGVARYVQHLVTDLVVPPRDILILSPRRHIGYGIRDALRDATIPTHSFYHEEALEPENAQEAFAFLTLLAKPDDRVAQRFLLGLGSPSWRSGAYRKLRTHCERIGCSPFDALQSFEQEEASPAGIAQLRERYRLVIERLAQLPVLEGVELIASLFPENQSWAEPVREIVSIATEEGDTATGVFEKLRVAITQPEMPESGDFVRVMSLHKSKGLTSRVVIVSGTVSGLIPFIDFDRTPAEQEALMHEQRRLFYVAITRPTDRLVISSALHIDPAVAYRIGARVRANGRVYASQFLHELGPSAPAAIAGAAWAGAGFQ